MARTKVSDLEKLISKGFVIQRENGSFSDYLEQLSGMYNELCVENEKLSTMLNTDISNVVFESNEDKLEEKGDIWYYGDFDIIIEDVDVTICYSPNVELAGPYVEEDFYFATEKASTYLFIEKLRVNGNSISHGRDFANGPIHGFSFLASALCAEEENVIEYTVGIINKERECRILYKVVMHVEYNKDEEYLEQTITQLVIYDEKLFSDRESCIYEKNAEVETYNHENYVSTSVDSELDMSSWATETYLRKAGYTVAKKYDLSDKERREIIQRVMV